MIGSTEVVLAVRRVTLAGRAVDGNFVKSADLRKGGELAFEMSDRCGRGD